MVGESSPTYREVIKAPVSLRMLGGSVALLGVGLVVGNIVVDPDAFTVTAGALAVVLGASVFSSRINTTVEGDVLRVTFFPLVSVRINLADVLAADETALSPVVLGGVGVRRRRGARAFLLSGGRAVRIVTQGEGTVDVQSVDPQQLIAAIEGRLPAA